MNTFLFIIFLLVLSVENFQLYQKVDATRNDAISLPLGSWFNSIEVLNNQNTDEIKAADISKKDETPAQEVPVKRKKTKRKKKKRNKKWQKNSTALADGRRKTPKRRLKKTMVTAERGASDSYETTGRRKPIYIIKSEEIKAEDNSIENDEPKQVFVVRKRVVRKKKKVDREWLKRHGNYSNTIATVTGRRFESGKRARNKMVATKDRHFNVSESVEDSGEEGIGRRKPVDIVVHIKMNE